MEKRKTNSFSVLKSLYSKNILDTFFNNLLNNLINNQINSNNITHLGEV